MCSSYRRFVKRACHALIAAWACTSFAQVPSPTSQAAQAIAPGPQSGTQSGTDLGDQLVRNQPPIQFSESSGTSGMVVVGNRWVPVDQLIPSTDSQNYVERLKSHGNDHDIDGIRQLHQDEAPRLQAEVGASGQAATTVNNSSKNYALQRRTLEQDSTMQASAQILREADNNLVLGQVFADCTTTTVEAQNNGGGTISHPQACSYVELGQQPGYRGRIVRHVTVSTPDHNESESMFIEVAPGTTSTFSEQLTTQFDPSTTTVSNFTVRISPAFVEGNYTISIQQRPSRANQWTYIVDIAHVAGDPASNPVLMVASFLWEGDPEFTFTPQCEDGNCDATGDEFCKAIWTCTRRAPVTVDGHQVSADLVAQQPPLYPVDPLDDPTGNLRHDATICMDAKLNIDCARIYSGAACWPADPRYPGSGSNCIPAPDNGSLPNSCPALEENDACVQTGAGCADGGLSEISGWCYIKTKLFSCREHVDVPEEIVTTQTQCSGNNTCLDGSCTAYSRRFEQHYSRTRASAQQVITQHILSDFSRPRPPMTVNAAQKKLEVDAFLQRAAEYERLKREGKIQQGDMP